MIERIIPEESAEKKEETVIEKVVPVLPTMEMEDEQIHEKDNFGNITPDENIEH